MVTTCLLHLSVPARGIYARTRQSSAKSPRNKPEDISIPSVATPPTEPTPSSVIASREAVLKACFITSGGLAAAGLAARQASHLLTYLGADCTTLLPCEPRPWHVGVVLGLVASVSALRIGLLGIWPDFARSSRAANKRVLSSLGPCDCVAVAFTSGVSEELLFRGALLPLIGLNIKGVLISAIVFGALHITGNRNVAFATWATFVGSAYGIAAVWTSDLYVPMFAHFCANLIAALYWKYNSVDTDEIRQDLTM